MIEDCDITEDAPFVDWLAPATAWHTGRLSAQSPTHDREGHPGGAAFVWIKDLLLAADNRERKDRSFAPQGAEKCASNRRPASRCAARSPTLSCAATGRNGPNGA